MKKMMIVLTCALTLLACDDIFIEDLTDKQVNVIAPSDGVEVKEGEMTFLWINLKGATAYHITIVRPSFNHASVVVAHEKLVADEDGTIPCSFKYNIPQGEYQWSIKAINEEYETREQVFSFKALAPEGDESNEPELP